MTIRELHVQVQILTSKDPTRNVSPLRQNVSGPPAPVESGTVLAFNQKSGNP